MSTKTQAAPLIEADNLPGVDVGVRFQIPTQALSDLFSFGEDANAAIMKCGTQPYACLLPWEQRRNKRYRRAVVRLDYVRVVEA